MKRLIELWGTALAVALVAGCALAYFLMDASVAEQTARGYRWVTYANTVLAGSTAMYAAYLWLRTELVGRAATLLAALGALGVVAGLALGALQSGAARIGLYEGTALFSAAAVLAYLGIERAYGSRSVGILVMPAVMVAVLCEMWLIVHGLALSGRPPNGLSAYWEAGHRFAMSLGYCPVALAGGLAALALVRRAEGVTPQSAAALSAAFSIGAPLLLVGAAMGAIWTVCDLHAFRRPAGFLLVSVLATGVVLLALTGMRGRDGIQRARLALGVFIAATAGLLAAGRISDALA